MYSRHIRAFGPGFSEKTSEAFSFCQNAEGVLYISVLHAMRRTSLCNERKHVRCAETVARAWRLDSEAKVLAAVFFLRSDQSVEQLEHHNKEGTFSQQLGWVFVGASHPSAHEPHAVGKFAKAC